MRTTSFAGLTALDAGEPLTENGGAFTSRDRDLIDFFLRLGARAHRHNAAEPLVDPADPPDLATATTGGTLPALTTLMVCYTLIDEEGGETLPSPVSSVTTPAPLDAPLEPPYGDVDYESGGSLTADDYTYVLTFVDVLGGETTASDELVITRDAGYPTARIEITGLTQIVDDVPGAVGWRLYRAKGVGDYGLLAVGAATDDEVIDDGGLLVDATIQPPDENTTNGASSASISVPALPAEATGFRVYVTTTGEFVSPSLYGDTRAPSEAASPIVVTTVLLEDGAPPDVSTSVGGAAQLDPDTDLLDWHFKRPVATRADLPTLDNGDGDVRIVLDERVLTMWADGDDAWHDVSGGGGGGGGGPTAWKDPVETEGDLPTDGNVLYDIRFVAETWAPYVWDGESWENLTFSIVAGGFLPQRGILEFTGGGITVVDNPTSGRTVANVPPVVEFHQIANRPAAADYTRRFVWVDDATSAEKLQFSDGSGWFAVALTAVTA